MGKAEKFYEKSAKLQNKFTIKYSEKNIFLQLLQACTGGIVTKEIRIAIRVEKNDLSLGVYEQNDFDEGSIMRENWI